MKLIVINGRGGSGKDSIVKYVHGLLKKEYHVWNLSSITPSKKAAKIYGWNGIKTEKNRKFLADLKQLSIEYDNHPTKYLIEEIKKINIFYDNNIIFLHIREPEEIKKIINEYENIYTLYVNRYIKEMGNDADDKCQHFKYDYVVDNLGEWKYTIFNIENFLREIGIENKYIEQGHRRIEEE